MLEILNTIILPYMEIQQAIAPAIIAAIIAGVASVAAAGASAGAQAHANKKNKEIAENQNAWNQTQWERENAYNSPSAMMARYKAAGLNPNIIYGQQNTAASSPRAAGYTHQAVDLGLDSGVGQAMQLYMQAQQLQMAQKENTASVALKQAQADAVRQQTLVNAAREVQLDLTNTKLRSTMPYQVGAIKEQYNRLVAGNILLGQQQVLNNQKYDINERKMAIQEQLASIQWEKLQLESQRNQLGWANYNVRKWQLDNMERRARKEFNMNYQDWNDMRIGKIGNTYLKWLDPVVRLGSAYARSK